MTTKNIITLAMLSVTMASCSQKQQEEETTAIITSTTEKNDTVMKEFVKENLYWTREPKQYVITDSLITIETEPNTDLWQRTYYGFSNDNAPVLQMKTSCQYFSFTVKTEFNSSALFDQCGIAIYLDSDNWMKASIEYENEDYQRLGSVVTNNGYSDWATHDIPSSIREMWYRLVAEAAIITSKQASTESHSTRCALSTCLKATGKYHSAYMQQALSTTHSPPDSPIWKWENVNGNHGRPRKPDSTKRSLSDQRTWCDSMKAPTPAACGQVPAANVPNVAPARA